MKKIRELAATIIDVFDDFLAEKNIDIPCADRGEQEDNSAAIYTDRPCLKLHDNYIERCYKLMAKNPYIFLLEFCVEQVYNICIK